MLNSYCKFLLFASSLLLTACGLLPKNMGSQPTHPPEQSSLKSLIGQNTQTNSAIHLLEKGKKQEAAQLIKEVLKINPHHVTATLLNKQLLQPASAIFKTQRITRYRVNSGDTLGKIAEEWLGNSLYFVSLAKLNQIKVPLNLQPGTLLKIPVTELSPLAIQESRRSNANIQLLIKYRKRQAYFEGLSKSNSLFVVKSDLNKLLHQHQLLLNSLARSTVSLSKRADMIIQINELKNFGRNKQQKRQYTHFINTQNRLLLLDEASLLFNDKSYIDAAKKMISAKKFEQSGDLLNNNQTNNNQHYHGPVSLPEIEKRLIEKLHEQAVVLYRKHELKQALQRWTLVLQLEPHNELAQKYTERTQKLLTKLNQI